MTDQGHDRPQAPEPPAPTGTRFPVVGVGASAGGLEAFADLLRDVPTDTPLAFVLIQHLDPSHPSSLREALARATRLPVEEVRDGLRPEPGHVYVTPSHADVGILQGAFSLTQRPASPHRPHLPIDEFFEALAVDRGSKAVGIVLSGTGADGVEGLRAIKAEGGLTLAQDPQSAKYDGMPRAAVDAGVVDLTLPVSELARELQRLATHPLLAASADPPANDGLGNEQDLDEALALLRTAIGVDFRDYKATSVRRRLARRMAVLRLTSLSDYLHVLRDDPGEASSLLDELLIHVTSFFRDPVAFRALADRVFPELLQMKRAGGTIRIWSAGCSTGEEVYSLAIALSDFLAGEQADVPIQIFATDTSEKAIAVARAGIYTESALREVAPERLARYFTRLDGGRYEIAKTIRDRCAFVKHDLASDPPFSKLDLVSCRNVLIYFGPELQKRVLGLFHFALNYPGYLLLGRAENTDGATLFTAVDKEAKIFARTAAKSTLRLAAPREVLPSISPSTESHRRLPPLDSLIRKAEERLLDQYAPPGVIVNERMHILRFRGRTGGYLEPAAGEPQYDLIRMARPGLVADLRIAVAQASQDRATVRRPGVRIGQNGSARTCDIVVIPLVSPPEARESLFAVLFEEPLTDGSPEHSGSEPPPRTDPGSAERIAKLEADLGATKAYLQSIIEDHERTNDELTSANEELLSSNEELQSLNEELQTAKEELQSTNEELSTLNEELQTRTLDLDSTNSDLVNILASIEVPIVIVDAQRRIRRFTPKARPILNLLPGDVGRPIDDIRPTVRIDQLDRKIADVVDRVALHEEEVRDPDGRWFRLRIRPYLAADKRIEGAVLSLVDIDALKRALGAAEWARDYAKATVEAVRTPLVLLDERLTLVSVNAAFRAQFGSTEGAAEGHSLFQLQQGTWHLPALRLALERAGTSGEPFEDLELDCTIPLLGRRTVSSSGRALATPGGERFILLTLEDITARRHSEMARERLLSDAEAARAGAEAASRAKDQFLAMLSHELRTPLSTLLMQAELMLRTPMDEAAVRKAGETIGRAARAQAQLIDDLLDLSGIVTGKLRMEMQPASLTAIVRDAAEVMRPSLDSKHIVLALHLDDSMPPVLGDPARLRQVVLNLLTNAAKFTLDHGRVTVTVDAVNGYGRVAVRDTGVGIEPGFLPHVFQHFSQEDAVQTRRVGGLGLGLGLVRYLVEAHGGTVEAASEGKGRGATFTVRIPLQPTTTTLETRDTTPVSSGDDTQLDGTRILLVEDDAGTRDALVDVLRIHGAEVHAATCAADALRVIEAFRPDLLICDIAMPDEDGCSLLTRIRALGPSRGGQVPALALTALGSDEDRRRVADAGFQLNVLKPVDIRRLMSAIAELRERTTGPPRPAHH